MLACESAMLMVGGDDVGKCFIFLHFGFLQTKHMCCLRKEQVPLGNSHDALTKVLNF